ncbi:MAG: hypothetical protein HC906_16350 [Bacteroidales bacterium]|nr:hypothetical protein [Bacteroidales bacterium]
MKDIGKIKTILFFSSYFLGFANLLNAQNYVDPYIESITLVNTVDLDNDGYFEEWSFRINVDAVYMDDIASGVLIYIEEPTLLPSGADYGPYTFTGYNTNDAVTIGPFSTEGIEGFPADLYFTINASNYIGTYYSGTPVLADDYEISVAPVITSVNIVNAVNTDGDDWLESFYFEIDVDPDNGPMAKDVEVIIKVDGAFFDNTPKYDFIGITGEDKILVGPINASSFNNLPRIIGFQLIASNDEGNDSQVEYVYIDGSDNGVVINSIYPVNMADDDRDNFYEEWYLLVNLDNKQNLQLEEVRLVVYQNGIERYSSELFALEGISQTDNPTIGPFSYTDYSSSTSELSFTVEAQHAFGNVQKNVAVPVDGIKGPNYVDPYIQSIQLVNTVDADNDSYFEQWSFKIDVDAAYQDDIANNVYIYIQEPNILPSGASYGPYTFTGYNTSDAVTIGPFNSDGIAGLPADFDFTFEAENSYGSSNNAYTVHADDYNVSAAPVIKSIDQLGPVDTNIDSWLEAFFLEIDIDPADGSFSKDVYITVTAEGGVFSKNLRTV